MEYLTNIVGDKYKLWEAGNLVFLFSGTGSGKTTISLKKVAWSYLEQGKTVLYLVPRIILKQQIDKDMRLIQSKNPSISAEYNKNFTVWTYQYLENLLLKNGNIKEFDLIICDEFHYFLVDSTFNANTQISYDFIFKETYGLKLFLSATPQGIMDYIKTDDILSMPLEGKENFKLRGEILRGNKKPYTHELPKNYDYLNIKYLSKDEEITEIVKNSKGKTVIFISSKESGEKLKKNLEENNIECIFITAGNKETEAKENVEELVYTNSFSKKVLITTSVLDVGVNLLDTEIENMIIAANEPVEFLQMLGRFRVIQEGQEVSLYIYARDARYFQNLRDKQIEPKIICCEYLENLPDLNRIKELELIPENNLPEGYNDFLYFDILNNKTSFNKLAAYRFRQLYDLYNEIYNGLKEDKDFFIKKQLEWLNLNDTFELKNYYSTEIQKNRIQELEEAIKEEVRKNKDGMFKDDIEKVMLRLKPLVRSIDNNNIKNDEQLSNKKFNRICKIYDIPYCIGQRQEKSGKERRNKYYLTHKNDDIIKAGNLEIPL